MLTTAGQTSRDDYRPGRRRRRRISRKSSLVQKNDVDPVLEAGDESARAPSTRKFLQKLKDRETQRNLDQVEEVHSDREYSDYGSEEDEKYSIRKSRVSAERAELQQIGMIPPDEDAHDKQFFAPIDQTKLYGLDEEQQLAGDKSGPSPDQHASTKKKRRVGAQIVVFNNDDVDLAGGVQIASARHRSKRPPGHANTLPEKDQEQTESKSARQPVHETADALISQRSKRSNRRVAPAPFLPETVPDEQSESPPIIAPDECESPVNVDDTQTRFRVHEQDVGDVTMEWNDGQAKSRFYPNEGERLEPENNNNGSDDNSDEKGEIEPGFFF